VIILNFLEDEGYSKYQASNKIFCPFP
jgi:hypothetical protein